MTLLRSTERTVAIIERWGPLRPIVDIISDRSASLRAVKRSRKPKGETVPQVRDIASAPVSTSPSSAEGEELLTTQAAALYCGYLSEVGIRKAKHDRRLVPARVGKNRSYLWRRSDLDAHNLRRGYVRGDAHLVGGGVVRETNAGAEVGDSPGTSAEGDRRDLPADVSPDVAAPVVEPIVAAASAPSVPTDVADVALGSVEEHSPTAKVSEAVEIARPSFAPLADQSNSPSSTTTLVLATRDGEPHTAAGNPVAVTPSAWRRRPLAAVLRVVLLWEVAGAAEPTVPTASPEVPRTTVVRSPRCNTGVPYRGALPARQHRASG